MTDDENERRRRLALFVLCLLLLLQQYSAAPPVVLEKYSVCTIENIMTRSGWPARSLWRVYSSSEIESGCANFANFHICEFVRSSLFNTFERWIFIKYEKIPPFA